MSGIDATGWWHRRLVTFTAAAVVALAAAAVAWLVYSASDVLCLIFLGVVFGVFLRHLGRKIGGLIGGHHKAGVIIATFLFVGVVAGVGWFLGDRIAGKVSSASGKLQEAAKTLRENAKDFPLLSGIVDDVPGLATLAGEKTAEGQSGGEQDGGQGGGIDASSAVSTLAGFFRTTLGAAGSLLVLFFLGVFFAAEPATYRDGAARLVPSDRRARFVDLCDDVGETLWNYLKGMAATMLITGTLTGLTMWALGVPLPLFLGVFTGLACFVPNFGAAASALIAAMLAVPQGFGTVMAVLAAYAAVQAIESNVITPMIQKNAVSVPPALLLGGQLTLGVLFGFMGLVAATPLMAAGLVAVRRVYVEDEFDLLHAERPIPRAA